MPLWFCANECSDDWLIPCNSLAIEYASIYFPLSLCVTTKIMYPKYSKHWPYTVAQTSDCVRCKILNHGLNNGLFLSIFKLIPCPIHWIVYVIAYLNFVLDFKAVQLAMPKTARSAQARKSISFIWIVWSTLYVYF